MKKSKYNCSKSIPISSLSKEELKVAMKEWAEGSESLEKLLWNCYNNGIETGECHIDNGFAYISLYGDSCSDEGKEKIKKMASKIQEFNNSQIFLAPNGGNPFSGPNWFRPFISFAIYDKTIEENDKVFEQMNDAINLKEPVNNKGQVFTEIYDFLDFFKDKDCGLVIRAIHTKTDKYTFAMEIDKGYQNVSKIFTKAGYTLDKSTYDRPRKEWKIEVEDSEVLAEKIKYSKKIIFNEWDIEPLNEINENMSFNTAARIKRKQFGDTLLGRKRFDLWLNMKRMQMDAKIIKGIYKKYKQKKIYASGLQDADRRLKEAEKKLEGKEHENDGKEK